MVREAYSLLRQSIIHVEQDDINLDEDEDEVANGHANGDDDENMDAADIAALDAAESSYNAAATSSAAGPSSGVAGAAPSPTPAPARREKLQITSESRLWLLNKETNKKADQ